MALNVVIDLSHFNEVSDFNVVKADGIVGVIHKATEGIRDVDPKYLERRGEALAAGLWWGAYHFATGDDAAMQADFFLTTVAPGPTDLIVLDFEQNPAGESMTLEGAEQFVTQVQAATGRWPGLYGGEYLKELLGENQNPTLSNCWFWLSEYGPEAHVPANWQEWTMWQYTDGTVGPEPHFVQGIGACDRDLFNGELDDLTRLWGQAS